MTTPPVNLTSNFLPLAMTSSNLFAASWFSASNFLMCADCNNRTSNVTSHHCFLLTAQGTHNSCCFFHRILKFLGNIFSLYMKPPLKGHPIISQELWAKWRISKRCTIWLRTEVTAGRSDDKQAVLLRRFCTCSSGEDSSLGRESMRTSMSLAVRAINWANSWAWSVKHEIDLSAKQCVNRKHPSQIWGFCESADVLPMGTGGHFCKCCSS